MGGAQPGTVDVPLRLRNEQRIFLDKIAFADQSDEEIAAARSEDAAVAQLEARRSYYYKVAQLDKAAGLDAMKSNAHDDVVQRRNLRRSRRAETVAVLGLLAVGVVFGDILLSRWTQAPQAAAGQAAGAVPASAQVSGAPEASVAAPSSAAAVAPASAVASASAAEPAGGTSATLQGQFDLASMATKGTSLEMLDKVVTENQILLTYEKGSAPATPAKVSGTVVLTITLDDEMLFAIHSAVGKGALGIDPPPMPDTWRGCTTTSEMRGDLVGAQTASGKTSFKGTTSLSVLGSVRGCEKTGANITVGPPQASKRVPWTATGDETGLRGRISFPASSAIAPGTAWAFAVHAP